MTKIKAGDFIYDSRYECLSLVIENNDGLFKVKELGSQNTYEVYGVFVYTLDKAADLLEAKIVKYLELNEKVNEIRYNR